MTETLDLDENNNGQRPVFLTVVCILSFVGIGLAVIGYITALAGMGVASSAISNAMAKAGTSMVAPSVGLTWAYIIVGFICVIVQLMGVIKMWKLQKKGFMLYTVAAVVSVIMSFIYSGFSFAGVIFPAAFVAMYYANLKAMK